MKKIKKGVCIFCAVLGGITGLGEGILGVIVGAVFGYFLANYFLDFLF